MAMRYRDAGVSIAEADRAVASVRKLARATFTPHVLSGIGSFGAMYALRGWKQPVLISSADGVGTKLKVAFLAGRHDTVGEDLVNHCVNDIAVQGAAPLFFLDYFACGRLEAGVAASVISGMARGCRRNGCALIGGETAEMPGFYTDGEYDVAGFIVGAAERTRLLTGGSIRAGDLLLALPSTGLHTNGYSLARRIFFDLAGYRVDTHVAELGCTLGEELLKVHRSYLRPLRALLEAGLMKGAAHITGGGITDNTPRMLPAGLSARILTGSWTPGPVFQLLRRLGQTPEEDWRRTFNLGVGMILAVAARDADAAVRALKRLRERCWIIGDIVKTPRGKGRVLYQ
jgi:phosphoribosylformylglycinamidine cyclo-ligase